MANIITGIRIICSIALLFCPVFSPGFYALYVTAGISDMIDGTVARRTGTVSEFGSKFDTAADIILAAVCLLKLIPVLNIPTWLFIWIAIIALIKMINIISGYVMHKEFVAVHTVMNKVTGLFLFILPLTFTIIDLKHSGTFVSAAATFAAIQEGHFIRTGRSENQMKTKNRCCTYFRISGDFDPDVISARLGIVPEDCWKKGDRRIDGSLYEYSSWTCGRCDEYDVYVENQMRKTISGLLDKTEVLNQIRNELNAGFILEIVPEIYVDDINPCLAPPLDVIDFCHATRTEIDIDLYVFPKRRSIMKQFRHLFAKGIKKAAHPGCDGDDGSEICRGKRRRNRNDG